MLFAGTASDQSWMDCGQTSARAHAEIMCLVLYRPTHGSRWTGEQRKLKVCETKFFLTLQTKYHTPEDIQVFLYHMAVPAQQQIFPAYFSLKSLTTYDLQPLWNLRYNTSLEEPEKSHHSAYSRKFKRCLGNSVLPLAITMGLFAWVSPFLRQIYCAVFW